MIGCDFDMKRKRKKGLNKVFILSMTFVFCLITGYSAFETNVNLNAKGNIKEKSRVIQCFDGNLDNDFHNEVFRNKIVSATFVSSNVVPSSAIQKWDVSEDKKGGVMAWILDSAETGMYDLYIGAKDGVIANSNSSQLFFDFANLEEINFNGNFDTTNMTKMNGMFGGNSKFESLDLSDFDTFNVTEMYGLFCSWLNGTWGVSYLKSVNFGDKFYTGNVTNMADMFSGTKFTSLDLKWMDTCHVTDMWHMFTNCTELESLNLCSFDTSNVIQMSYMFGNTPKLQNIYVSDKWDMDNAKTVDMFLDSNVSSFTTGKCNI